MYHINSHYPIGEAWALFKGERGDISGSKLYWSPFSRTRATFKGSLFVVGSLHVML